RLPGAPERLDTLFMDPRFIVDRLLLEPHHRGTLDSLADPVVRARHARWQHHLLKFSRDNHALKAGQVVFIRFPGHELVYVPDEGLHRLSQDGGITPVTLSEGHVGTHTLDLPRPKTGVPVSLALSFGENNFRVGYYISGSDSRVDYSVGYLAYE